MSQQFTTKIKKNKDVELSSQAQLSVQNQYFIRPHYELSCWKDSEGNVYYDTINVNKNTTISAQWRGEKLSVTYDSGWTEYSHLAMQATNGTTYYFTDTEIEQPLIYSGTYSRYRYQVPECFKTHPVLSDYLMLKSVRDYDNTTQHIGNSGFAYCTNLTSAYFPGVYKIDMCAFENCQNLNNIEISSVRYIGNYAFEQNFKIKSFNIPNVKYIGDVAFYNCSALTSIIMPNVKHIGYNNPFYRTKIKSLSVAQDNANFMLFDTDGNRSNSGTLLATSDGAAIWCSYYHYNTVYKLPDSILSICYQCFSDCEKLNTLCSDTVVYADFVDSSIKEVYFPSLISGAFNFNAELEKAYLPNAEYLGGAYWKSAFRDCAILSLDLPKIKCIFSLGAHLPVQNLNLYSIETLGDEENYLAPFSGCDKLSSVTFSSENTKFKFLDALGNETDSKNAACLINTEDNSCIWIKPINPYPTSQILPSHISCVYGYANTQNYYFTTMICPGVQKIGTYNFNSNFTKLVLSDYNGVCIIDEGTFWGLVPNLSVYVPMPQVESYKTATNWVSIVAQGAKIIGV